ncbi:MAG: TolC family protein [Pyrinomonadaceae bacterium]
MVKGKDAARWQRLRAITMVMFAFIVPAAGAQTTPRTPTQPPAQTPAQPPPHTAQPQTQKTQTPPQQPPAPLGGRQAGATGAGDAAASALQSAERSSSQFLDRTGATAERLVETGFSRRADLLAARQRLAVAEGRVVQAGLRPNPTLDAEYGSPRFLAGEPESDLSVGVSQVFERGGKRRKRIAAARLELAQTRAEVLALERVFAADIRAAYARAVAAGRQLDALEDLIRVNEELVRVTNARLTEGDVAPLELNLVRVETDRLRAQVIRTRADLEGEIISLRALAGFETSDALRLAPLPDRPPRLDLTVTEATELALRERPDLQAARLGEELGTARVSLAESLATPNVAASVRFSRNRDIRDLPANIGGGDAIDTDNELTFGVSIELPFFNRNQGEIASAVGERAQAGRQREFLEATIKRDVALSFRRYRAAAETLVLYSMQIIPRAEENFRSVRAAYNLGEFSVFDVVQEQRRFIESETGYNEALRDYYTALAELERALGTTIPVTGFAPAQVSVLPDINLHPSTGNAKNGPDAEPALGLRRSLGSLMPPPYSVTAPPGEIAPALPAALSTGTHFQSIEKGKPK